MAKNLNKLTAVSLAAALSVSSTVASASMTPGAAVPNAPTGAVAACAATAAVAAGAAIAQVTAQPGCVLPVGGVPVAAAPPPMMIAEPASGGLFGLGLPAILLGLAALAGAYFLLFDDDDDGEGDLSPVTRG